MSGLKDNEMKPTQEQVIAWAREVGLTDWEISSYGNQLEWFAALAYEAGRKDEALQRLNKAAEDNGEEL